MYQIAIIGKSGAGKSTFINKLLGMEDTDEDDAKSGVNEITNAKCYQHPNNPFLAISDLPSYGTPRNPVNKTYIQKMEISRYDAILIFSMIRFWETDNWMKNELKKMGKPMFFVRTKIDETISSNWKSKGIGENETIEEVRCHLEVCLNANTEDEKRQIYLISNFETERHDYVRLLKDIAKLPYTHPNTYFEQFFKCN